MNNPVLQPKKEEPKKEEPKKEEPKKEEPKKEEPKKEEPKKEEPKKEEPKKEEEEKSKKRVGSKREKRTVGQYYDWKEDNQFLELLKPSFSGQDYANLTQKIAEESKTYNVTMKDILALPANVMNQREVDKVVQVAVRYQEARDNAVVAISNLLATAQVNAKQREAKALKKKLENERKARREEKTQ